MNHVLKNFITTLRRFKLSSTLNIVGLSVAFAAFIVIMMQVNYELSFDKSYKKTGRIYRIEMSWDGTGYTPLMSRPLANSLVNGVSQIEFTTLLQPFFATQYMVVDKNGQQVGFNEKFDNVYPDYVKIFDLDFVYGTADAIEKPDNVILPVSVAQKLFGTTDCVGKTITMADWGKNEDGSAKTLTVGAVHKDFPAASSQTNSIRIKFDDENLHQWGNSNYNMYVCLRNGASAADATRSLVSQLKTSMKDAPAWFADNTKMTVRLTKLEDVYYQELLDYDMNPKGNRATTNILIAIALLVILIAAINFVNFATSLVPLRIKSINTQKVLGSQNSTLRFSMIFESVAFSVVAFGVAFIWIEILRIVDFSQYLLTPIAVGEHLVVIWATAGLAVITGILAGLYPAFYSTSFEPALVLKGSFGLTPKGRMLRTALIGVQFIISIGLIIAAMFLQLQNNYMRSFDGGMKTDHVAIVNLSNEMAQPEKKELIMNNLKSKPIVSDVAFSQFKIGANDNYMTWGRDFRDGESINFACLPVSWNFCSVMGLEITDGRDFEQADQISYGGKAIFNEVARKKMKLTTDDTFGGHDTTAIIAGFVEDFNFKSLRYPIEPMALYNYGSNGWSRLNIAYIRLNGDPYAGVDHIKRTLEAIDPTYPLEISFYDQVFDNLYQKERKTTTQITAFSLLAVIISLFGVFGIIVFETQFRRREIGVRKVYGSSVGEVLVMFNARFVWIVAVCFVIAAPAAYIGVSSWLETFEYKIGLSWWVFAVAFLIVMTVTLVTVTIQSYCAATENPIRSLSGN